MQLSYDNSRTKNFSVIKSDIRNEKLPPLQLFEEFYESQCNHKMSSEQYEFIDSLIKEVWGEIL
ncbi:MAG: exonuclease SbcCD subunit D C-terminal domain-containing protein, partial [Ruminococcus sp.]|nr:exonuclease SbcCD subunit D C-terminal domain-containing protein [Ruminococcus sp.]